MFINYIKTAIRSLLRHRFFSAINIFGLAVAMSICMSMIMLVADQMSYDRYNTNADRIYRVKTIDVDDKGRVMLENQWNSGSPIPVGRELVEKYTGVEKAVSLTRGFGNGWLEFENQNVNIPLAGFFADAGTLDFFQYELQFGDAATALKEPFTVVLTRQASNKLFKQENPVGQTIKVGDLGTYTVTGVLKETGRKSHIVFEGLASMASMKSLEASGKLNKTSESWTTYWQSWTYIMVEKGKSEAEIQSHLDKIYAQHIGSNNRPGVFKMTFGLQHILDITPGDIMNNSIGPQLPWAFVYFLGGLALVILLTSCFNFTNLSIARSLTRAREIGVRKVVGAARRQIFTQFIVESVAVAFAALVFALVLLVVLKPMILELNFAKLFRWDLYNGFTVYAVFAVFALVVGLLAGFFPAVVLSGFQPIKVLKNLTNIKLFSRMGMRKALLVSQFTLSLFFIITVIVMYNQLNLFTHKDHGFNMKSNILVTLNSTSSSALKTELQKYSNIISVSAASHVPAAGTSWGAGIKRNPSDPDIIDVNYFMVDEDYAENMKVKLLAGNFFSERKGESNKNFVVINEAAVKKLKFKTAQEAIGEPIQYLNDTTTRTILGVVSNYNHRDLTREISPMLLLYEPREFNLLQVAYFGTYDNASKSIEKAWATVNPGLKIDYREVESEINKYYDVVFGDLLKVLGFVSFLAILISCLGMLGMATYATETRIREISIRKVLGSSSAALVLLLSRGFLSILAIAIGIGVPLSYFVNNFWLELIANHTTIGIGVISISVMTLALFGAVTIGSQTIRATFVKPVDNLKNE
ncbi:ABC transporter permease [Cytophagales bacterium WSM2-2]|nr:ABC transporter permease [Cytophagales bacterium WSM2-2]